MINEGSDKGKSEEKEERSVLNERMESKKMDINKEGNGEEIIVRKQKKNSVAAKDEDSVKEQDEANRQRSKSEKKEKK